MGMTSPLEGEVAESRLATRRVGGETLHSTTAPRQDARPRPPNPAGGCILFPDTSHCPIPGGCNPVAKEIVFPVALVYRKVGPGAVLAEGLFYPEFARLAPNRGRAGAAAR